MTAPTRRPPVVRAGPRIAARAKTERRDRRYGRAKRGGYLLLGLLPLVLLGWLVTSSSVLGVRTVTVAGATRLTAAQVQGAAAVRLGTPLARVDTGAVSRRVGALAGVAAVSVTRGWPSTLHVTVTERQPVASMRQTGRWALVDASGTPFAVLARQPAGLPVLDLAHPGPHDDATRSALRVLGSLPPTLGRRITSIRAPSPSGVVLVLASGQAVIWGSPGDSATKAAAVAALAARGARFIDVSSPGVVTTG